MSDASQVTMPIAFDQVAERLADITPSLFDGMMRLRPYQMEACDSAFREWQERRSTLIVMATGTGKTVTFAHIALCWPNELGRVLVLAHREELIDQNAEKIAFHTDERPGIEMGILREGSQGHGLLDRSKVLVSSVQSMARRLEKFDPQDFGLVIIDEAHHSPAASYRKILDHFQQNPDLRLLGVTATPKRADESALGDIFESCCYQMDIERGIEEGWLVDVEQKYIVVKGLDFSRMKTTAGDLNERDLEAGLFPGKEIDRDKSNLTPEELAELKDQEAMLHAVVDPTVKEANGRSTLVFGVTVEHARRLCEVFNRHPGVHAECVFGDTPKDIRREIIGRFRRGQLQVLVGCAVFTEGFDAPETAVVAVARPTKSLTLYTQIIGRGTRPIAGTIEHHPDAESRRAAIADSRKPSVTVLDFVGNSGRHKLVSTLDVLGGRYSEQDRDAAREWMIEHGETNTPEEAVKEHQQREAVKRKEAAEAQAKFWREQKERLRLEAEKRRQILASADYHAERVSPFTSDIVPDREFGELRGGASDQQVKLLVNMGIRRETALSYTVRQAGAIITAKKNEIAARNVGRSGGDWTLDFGKHFGRKLSEVPGYARWMVSEKAEGFSISQTAKHHASLMLNLTLPATHHEQSTELLASPF